MRIVLFLAGTLVVIFIVLFWPPAVVHYWHDGTISASISDVRAFIFVLAVVTFTSGVVYGVVSAARHRKN